MIDWMIALHFLFVFQYRLFASAISFWNAENITSLNLPRVCNAVNVLFIPTASSLFVIRNFVFTTAVWQDTNNHRQHTWFSWIFYVEIYHRDNPAFT